MSERDWKQTPTLDEFNAMYDEDDNIWWRIACGHHQNLYEAAVERYQTAEAQIQRVRHDLTDFYKGYNKASSDVFSAMNGWGREECPTCSWPVRETVTWPTVPAGLEPRNPRNIAATTGPGARK